MQQSVFLVALITHVSESTIHLLLIFILWNFFSWRVSNQAFTVGFTTLASFIIPLLATFYHFFSATQLRRKPYKNHPANFLMWSCTVFIFTSEITAAVILMLCCDVFSSFRYMYYKIKFPNKSNLLFLPLRGNKKCTQGSIKHLWNGKDIVLSQSLRLMFRFV